VQPYWTSKDGRHVLYNADCMDVLPTLAGVDACVTDPPYGIAHFKGPSGNAGAYRNKEGTTKRNSAKIYGDDKPFDPSPLFAFENVLMFGANHYAKRLPDYGRWLAWNKLESIKSFDSFSDVEFMWHSQGGKASRICNYMWKGGLACRKAGENNGRRDHPTQKPVGLMVWCIEQTKVPQGSLVLDPYAGSGSTCVACIRTSCRSIGVEINREYCDVIVRRMEQELSQLSLLEAV